MSRLLLLVLLLWPAAACAGPPRSPDVRHGAPAAVPSHLAVAPPSGLRGPLGRELWLALARAALERGFEPTRDPDAARLLLELEERRSERGLARDARLAARRAAVHDALLERFGVEAVMHAAVVPRRARFEDGVARWDGAVEPIQGPAHDVHSRVDGYDGTADAWSLRVWVEDAAGRVLAEAFGGLALAERMISSRWERSAAQPPLDRPDLLVAAAERAVETLPRPR